MDKSYQLNESADFIFSYNNTVYKTTINITDGIITVEELHNTINTDRDIISTVLLNVTKDTTNDTVITAPTITTKKKRKNKVSKKSK